MENGMFLTANYAWPFYVTNNRTLDDETYFRAGYWNQVRQDWFASGQSLREIDQFGGQRNHWLRKDLEHPTFDEYWQALVPYGDEYARINIPVLTITGYYDDGQISALHYLTQHLAHNASAEHYLVIGPYDHFGTQTRTPRSLRGLELDPTAVIDTPELTFAFIDYVLKGAERPALLKGRLNLAQMGADRWIHADSLQQLHGTTRRLHFTGSADSLALTEESNQSLSAKLTLDYHNRDQFRNNYYPWPIVRDELGDLSGLVFLSDPITDERSVDGQLSGLLKVRSNKKDFDFGVVLYEVWPMGGPSIWRTIWVEQVTPEAWKNVSCCNRTRSTRFRFIGRGW